MDIEIRGDYAFCPDQWGLSVWDISDPENLFKTSFIQTQGSASNIHLNGNYAYISDRGYGLVVIDISDPENPEIINYIDVEVGQNRTSSPSDLEGNENWLYLCAGRGGLYIASTEDPSEPEVLYHYHYDHRLNAHNKSILTGDALYLATNYDLYILNVDDPENVEVVNIIDQGGINMTINENRLGIVNGGETYLFSLDNPHAPQLESVIERHSAHSIEINGDHAYTGKRGIFSSFNISNLAEPELVSRLGCIVRGEILTYIDGIVFGEAYGNGIMAVSVEEPANPELLNEPPVWHHTKEFVIKDSLAFVLDAGGQGTLQILNISDPTEPEIIGEFDGISTQFHTLEILGDYVYYISRGGIRIIDVSDPTAPQLAGRSEEPHYRFTNETEIIDGYLYFTNFYLADDGPKTLTVWDLSDPVNPELTFSADDFDDQGGHCRSWYSDNYLYQMHNNDDEILIYSLEDPAEPDLVAHWVNGQGGTFFVCNSILYISRGNRLDMYNVENQEPDFLRFMDLPFSINSVTVDGEIAYIRDYSYTNLICLSLEDPLNPEMVGFYPTSYDIGRIIPHNGYIFVGNTIEFGVYQLDYEIGDNADFMISMHEGWNLVSSPFVPEDRDIEALFSRLVVRRNLIMVKDHNGRFFLPAHDFNNIPHWDVNQGYLVKLNEADNLWITGEEVEADRPIPLQEGWSMAAYFPVEEMEAETAFDNIADELIIAKDGDGHFYLPRFNFNNMPPLYRGAGYQVKVSEEVELVWNVEVDELLQRCGTGYSLPVFPYDKASQGKETWATSSPGQTTHQNGLLHFTRKDETGSNMSILVTNLPEEGEIGAFTTSGICVGATAFRDQEKVGLAVWGDDESTEELDGLKEGEAFTLKFWNSNRSIEFDLEPGSIIAGSGLIYETDGFTFFAAQALPSIPDQYYLSQNYPNPFNSTTILPYGLPETSEMSIRIYDISGRLVETLIDSNVEPGYHKAIWDASTVSVGVYLVKMETGAFSSVRKVILVK